MEQRDVGHAITERMKRKDEKEFYMYHFISNDLYVGRMPVERRKSSKDLVAMVSDIALLEDEIVEITQESFMERKQGEFSNILDSAFASSDVVDYSVTYSNGNIICSMKVKYYENKYSSLWGGSSQVFYVTGTFNYNKNNGTASLISLKVE